MTTAEGENEGSLEVASESSGEIWRRRLARMLVIFGPLGLAVNVLCSLWIFQLDAGERLDVQLESVWRPNAPTVVRAAARDVSGRPILLPALKVEAVGADGHRQLLGELQPRAGGRVLQANLQAPNFQLGPMRLELSTLRPGDSSARFGRRSIDIELALERSARSGNIWVPAAERARAELARLQPEVARIDLWPAGRFLAGFDNRIWLRSADQSGKARSFHYRLELLGGEFAGHRARSASPVLVADGQTDAMGLADIRGQLASDSVRFRVALCRAKCDVSAPFARREFYLPSLPGGVRLHSSITRAKPGDVVHLESRTISQKRSVFVDVHRPDGSWAATIEKTVAPGEHGVSYTLPADAQSGLWQIEADHSGRSAGPDTALVRFWVEDGSGLAGPRINKIMSLYRAAVLESKLDSKSESDRISMLDDAERSLEQDKARTLPWPRFEAFLVETLPLRVFGAPKSVDTLAPAILALEAKQARWTVGLRIFMALGGLLFVSIFAALVWLDYRSQERSTAELFDDDEDSGVMIGRRALLLRGSFAVALVAVTIVLMISMMERFIWLG